MIFWASLILRINCFCHLLYLNVMCVEQIKFDNFIIWTLTQCLSYSNLVGFPPLPFHSLSPPFFLIPFRYIYRPSPNLTPLYLCIEISAHFGIESVESLVADRRNRFINRYGETDNYLCQMLCWLVHLSDCVFYLLRLFNFWLLNFFIYVVLPHTMVK